MTKSDQPTNKQIEYVVKQYSKMLFRICFMMVGNEQDAEDAVQNTFYKYINRYPKFNDSEHEKAWLIRVATNCCKDILRFTFRHTHFNIDEISDSYINPNVESIKILEMVLGLPVKYKVPIYLYYFENYKTDEIAHLLSISSSATRKRLQYGREILKIELGDDLV